MELFTIQLIDRLILNHSSFLFVQLPLFCDDPWIDANLNHLLYKKKIPLVLTSFEENIHTNSQIRIEQILQSNAYYISLDLNYITALDSELCLKRIISREISVLPCISHHLSNYVGVVAAFDHLKDRLGTPVYQNLCRNFLNAEKTFFSHHYYCTK